MNNLALTLVRLTPSNQRLPLLVLGPSLGTSARALWGRCAALLEDRFEIAGWELPGHGQGRPATSAFTVEDLADSVIAVVQPLLTGRLTFHYAGDSIGGAVGLALLVHHSDRIEAATLACTGARIGTSDGWRERAAAVRAHGTSVMLESSAQRWFGPGFVDREPEAATQLLDALRHTDSESYALTCEALAGFDATDQLPLISPRLTLIAGSHDESTPPAGLQAIAATVRSAQLIVLDGVAHLAPIENPQATADAVAAAIRPDGNQRTVAEVDAGGMAVRRAVTGNAWVERAIADTTEFTADFQQFITRYAWGTVWTRPGLDRRSRSMITITALIARGHHEELAMHIRAALTNGLSREEIKEVLIHSAIYCGVPAANAAFRVAQTVFDDIDHGG